MKKTTKLISTVLAILMMAVLLPVTASAQMTGEMATARDAYHFVQAGGGIGIQKGTWYHGEEDRGEVYVVGLVGTNGSLDPSDIRGRLTCMQSCFSANNKYVKETVKRIQADIPKGSRIILIGHSLGGMVCQQVAANKTVKNDYEVLYTLGIGSPYIITGQSKEGSIHRLADRADIVPGLSIAGFCNVWAGNVSYESSGYVAGNAHTKSYDQGNCWLKYDCFGMKNGSNKVVF